MDPYAILQGLCRQTTPVRRVQLGLNWTSVEVEGSGLCFSPLDVPRTLSWPGTLVGRPACELATWLDHWNMAEAVIGQATVNALINHRNPLLADAQPLQSDAPPHLRVFQHFRSQVKDKKVVVIGRYPFLDQLWADVNYQCVERRPQAGDLPDAAAEKILPDADWVFITASSLANKTLPRLLDLAWGREVVLMGPSLPWIEQWRDFGVTHLAGVAVRDESALSQVVAEGGGTRLFADAVAYHLLSL